MTVTRDERVPARRFPWRARREALRELALWTRATLWTWEQPWPLPVKAHAGDCLAALWRRARELGASDAQICAALRRGGLEVYPGPRDVGLRAVSGVRERADARVTRVTRMTGRV